MSNYHVLTLSESEARAIVIFHIPVPDEDNDAGVNFQVAIQGHFQATELDGIIKTKVPWDIGVPETNQLEAGEIYEHKLTFEFNDAHASLAVKRAALDAKFTALSTNIEAKIRAEFRFWGMDRDV